MIKFLINILIILLIYSCNSINKDEISTNINSSIKKIEEIIEKKEPEVENINKNIQNDNIVFYYIGEPYFIEGVKYKPEENYKYSEIGIATFYGKELHNIKTINNDINKVTELLGRHKTLPLPSMVKITNLDNGLSIVIKIVDRHKDNTSLIQVSRKVAQLLGFYKNELATVRVEVLSDASKQWKNVTLSLNEPDFDKTISSAPTSVVSISEIDNTNLELDSTKSEILSPIEIESEEIENFNLFLKVFNFKNYNEIQEITKSINDQLKFTSEKNGSKYDLIIGPINNKDINNLVSYFISKGYKETKIILE
ncbi:MAG: hypothetical protein CBD97_03390 [Pelagibacteraceae bacterium TMED237]|nr:MAG: hypothetical protein CBD97_03390 [Pelagibacteraceae bacterium TMED237]